MEEYFSRLTPAGMVKAVRKGRTISSNLIVFLFTIPLYHPDRPICAGPKKLQVRDDKEHMQR